VKIHFFLCNAVVINTLMTLIPAALVGAGTPYSIYGAFTQKVIASSATIQDIDDPFWWFQTR
jgi:hypothetical protein